MSSAKMRVLKPEIDKLNEKLGDKDPMKKQQETMALYRKAGVNPMAGCLPMLLQMPILYAMFRFFPASIELRQQSFLWAEDLSTYDSIFSWNAEVPLFSWAFDNHISLFTILMAISMFLYTRTNSAMTAQSGPQAQQMKIMMNIMPFFMLFIFNSMAAGLTYYYFLSNMVSIGQHFVIKNWIIDEKCNKS